MADWIAASGTNSGSGTANITSFTAVATYAHGSTTFDDYKIFVTLTGLNTSAENELTFRLEDASNNLVLAEETVTVPTADATFAWQSSVVTLTADDTYTIKVKSGNGSDTSVGYSFAVMSPNTARAAIVAYGLDHLVFTSVSGGDVANNSVIAKMVDNAATAAWSNFVNTTQSLKAIRVLQEADSGDITSIDSAVGNIAIAIGLLNDVSSADVNAACDTAIADAALATAAGLATTDSKVDTLTTSLSTTDGKVDTIDGLLDGLIAGTSKVTPIDVDGLTFASAMEVLLAVLAGVSSVDGSTITFNKRDGSTAKIEVTVGSADGVRTTSTIQ